MSTVIGIFTNKRSAQRAMTMLRDRGLHLSALSTIARSPTNQVLVRSVGTLSNRRGAIVGLVWGACLGALSLILPGVGPFIATGLLALIASALTGALIGAAVGAVAAALLHFGGIPQAEAQRYEPLLETNKTLVAVKVRDEDVRHVRRTLDKAGAESVRGDETSDMAATQRI